MAKKIIKSLIKKSLKAAKAAKAAKKIKAAKAAQKIKDAKRAKLIKKYVKEAEELNVSEKDKERYRKGKQALKSYVPEIQKALDKSYGGSTLKVIKPVKKRNGGMIGGGRQSRQDRQK